jgi:flagellar basal body rod protein FlgG
VDSFSITAAAGMRARIEALDLLANNLANSGTAGFKADREFYSLYQGEESKAAGESGEGLPAAVQPVIDRNWIDFSQGQLQNTGIPTDLAIQGAGFFLLDSPSGPVLTRNGQYRISADGKITSPEGYEFQTVDPKRIRANPELPVSVGSDGTVMQDGAPLGRLKVVEPPDPAQVSKRDGAYFRLDTSALGQAKAARGEVQQGRLEMANFAPAEAAVRLVGVLRQFEALSKALQMGAEMGRKAVEDVARVNP